jgi:hypothetical protein
MIVLLFQGARKYMENQDAPEIQLPRVYLDRHAFHFWAVIGDLFGVLRPEAFFASFNSPLNTRLGRTGC